MIRAADKNGRQKRKTKSKRKQSKNDIDKCTASVNWIWEIILLLILVLILFAACIERNAIGTLPLQRKALWQFDFKYLLVSVWFFLLSCNFRYESFTTATTTQKENEERKKVKNERRTEIGSLYTVWHCEHCVQWQSFAWLVSFSRRLCFMWIPLYQIFG